MAKRTTLQLHGIAPDLIPQDAPKEVWNDGFNVLFRNKESYRVAGDLPVMVTSETPRAAVYIEANASHFWIWANENGIWAWDGSQHHDITPSAWAPAPDATFTACAINGLAVINASDSLPVWWDGITTNVCTTLPGWDGTWYCQAMRGHKNFLFAIGVEQEQRVRWSDAAEAGQIPGAWVPGPDNLAGFQDIAPLSAATLDGVTVRDSFLVFKRGSIWSFDFIGGTFIFRISKVFAERGCMATNALTRGPSDEVLFAGDDGDLYLTNGVQVQSVLDGRLQRTYYKNLQPSGLFSAATLHREKVSAIFFPTTSGTTACIVYDWSSGDVAARDGISATCAAEGRILIAPEDLPPGNWDDDLQAWDDDDLGWHEIAFEQSTEDLIVGSEEADGFYAVGSPSIDTIGAGREITAFVQKLGLSFGDAQARKTINRVWPKLEAAEGTEVTFRVGAQESTNGVVSWGPDLVMRAGLDSHMDLFLQGRFMALEVKSVGGAAWRLGTIDVEYQGAGKW